MAQKETLILTDDIDGNTTDGVQTIVFGLHGASYEIELAPKNLTKLEKALEPYLNVARKAGGGKKTRRVSTNGYDAKAVRAWAKSNKVTIPDRGRIPNEVVEQYRAAGN